MKMPAFSFDYPGQRRSRDRSGIQKPKLIAFEAHSAREAKGALKQVQGDEL
jgi:hypothetical protein